MYDRVAQVKDRIDRSAAEFGRLLSATTVGRGRRGRRSPPRLAPGSLPPLAGWTHGRGECTVAVVVYQGVSSAEVQMVATALAEPLEAEVRLVSADPGNVVAVEPARTLVAEPLDAVREPYGLIIPGGLAWRREAERDELVTWLGGAARRARGVLAVSTGSLLLATTGLLTGREAAGHWLAGDLMADLGASPSTDRVVHGRLIATASGALAGVEAAERLAAEMRFAP